MNKIKCICGNDLDRSLRFSDKCFFLVSVRNLKRLYCQCKILNTRFEILFISNIDTELLI